MQMQMHGPVTSTVELRHQFKELQINHMHLWVSQLNGFKLTTRGFIKAQKKSLTNNLVPRPPNLADVCSIESLGPGKQVSTSTCTWEGFIWGEEGGRRSPPPKIQQLIKLSSQTNPSPLLISQYAGTASPSKQISK